LQNTIAKTQQCVNTFFAKKHSFSNHGKVK